MSVGFDLVPADAVWVIHIAGPVVDDTQCCALCGQTLIDNVTAYKDLGDRRYETGGKVARLADVVTAPYPIPPGRRLPSGHVRCTSPTGDHR